jgi:hypothetical protein
VDLWIGGGGPASTPSNVGLAREGGRGVTEAGFIVRFLEGGRGGVAEDDDREGRGGAGDIELERLILAETDVLLGGGSKLVCGFVFRFTA